MKTASQPSTARRSRLGVAQVDPVVPHLEPLRAQLAHDVAADEAAAAAGDVDAHAPILSHSLDSHAMAPPADLRDWIALLEREGELVRVGAEVDPDLEITEIVDRTVKAGGPALLFERPKGSQHPLLINQFGTERRMCLAFGVERLDDVAERSSPTCSRCSRRRGSSTRSAASRS